MTPLHWGNRKSLLLQGLQIRNHHLYTCIVGFRQSDSLVACHAGCPGKNGFLYDVGDEEIFLGHGYGKQSVLLIEDKAPAPG